LGAFGEEDLLGFYLKQVNSADQHDFVVPDKAKAIVLEEGQWSNFQQRPERRRQLEADRVSYIWDAIIEDVSAHAVAGTLMFSSHPALSDEEQYLRVLARESRMRRRFLTEALRELVVSSTDEISFRSVAPSYPGDPFYVFVVPPRFPQYPAAVPPTDEERDRRRSILTAYCMVLMHVYITATEVVGIATERGIGPGGSLDIAYLKRSNWNEELAAEAAEIQRQTGWLKKTRLTHTIVNEYPSPEPRSTPNVGRNDPCPCGSGKKYKRCHAT